MTEILCLSSVVITVRPLSLSFRFRSIKKSPSGVIFRRVSPGTSFSRRLDKRKQRMLGRLRQGGGIVLTFIRSRKWPVGAGADVFVDMPNSQARTWQISIPVVFDSVHSVLPGGISVLDQEILSPL